MTRRSLILVVFSVAVVAACTPAKPLAAPSSTPAALVTAPPTVAPTPTTEPTVAPPTKKPKKTKKPKPTPTPETWKPAYTAHVCAAVAYLSDTKAHLDIANGLIGAQNYPRARSEVFEIVSLAVKAADEVSAAPAWAPGEELISWLKSSASSLGKGASRLIDGMAALDAEVMQAGSAEMATGGVQLANAEAAIDGLSAIYGPAGC